jgi:uncharacterized membrane protein YdjX (TVP38/TMEM64 family)
VRASSRRVRRCSQADFGEFLTVEREGRQAEGMSSLEKPVGKKKLPLMKLAVAGGVFVAIAAVAVYLYGFKEVLATVTEWKDAVVAWASAMGAGVFFAAMAILPAFGMPNLAFSLTAGPIFGAKLGFFAVTVYALLAITFNLTVTYWLARRWLRPLLTRLLQRAGYELPKVPPEDMTDFTVILRVTPGIPLFVQNYLLGLADVPFGRYMVISCVVQWAQNIGFIWFGDALNQGKGKMALLAIMLILALGAGLQLVRKHYGKKKTAPTPAS